MITIPPLQPGSELTSGHLIAAFDALRELQDLAVETCHYPLQKIGNTLLSSIVGVDRTWLGVIENTPGFAVYTDARYWVRPARCSNDDGDTRSAMTFEPLPYTNQTLGPKTATNLAELLDDTHKLPEGEIVLVFETRDMSDPVGKRFYFWRTPRNGQFFARVASSTQNGPNRWKYDFKEVEKTLPGYGGWTDRANGITGTAYNLIEDRNSLTGTLGNGVSVSSLKTDDAEFELRPIPDGTRVMITPVTLPNGTVEYWTQYENGIDGGCV